jgi:hypothetical protein
MNAKRLDATVRVLFGIATGLALTSGVAEAQLRNGRWQLSPQGGGAQAVERKPEPTVVVLTPQFVPHHHFVPIRPVSFILVPAIVMSDGSVFANFGFGFEPVLRPCNNAVIVGQPRVVAGNGQVLSQSQPTYTQPVPAQLTASQQSIRSTQSGMPVLSPVARTACFSRDAFGRVVVFRR